MKAETHFLGLVVKRPFKMAYIFFENEEKYQPIFTVNG